MRVPNRSKNENKNVDRSSRETVNAATKATMYRLQIVSVQPPNAIRKRLVRTRRFRCESVHLGFARGRVRQSRVSVVHVSTVTGIFRRELNDRQKKIKN